MNRQNAAERLICASLSSGRIGFKVQAYDVGLDGTRTPRFLSRPFFTVDLHGRRVTNERLVPEMIVEREVSVRELLALPKRPDLSHYVLLRTDTEVSLESWLRSTMIDGPSLWEYWEAHWRPAPQRRCVRKGEVYVRTLETYLDTPSSSDGGMRLRKGVRIGRYERYLGTGRVNVDVGRGRIENLPLRGSWQKDAESRLMRKLQRKAKVKGTRESFEGRLVAIYDGVVDHVFSEADTQRLAIERLVPNFASKCYERDSDDYVFATETVAQAAAAKVRPQAATIEITSDGPEEDIGDGIDIDDL